MINVSTVTAACAALLFLGACAEKTDEAEVAATSAEPTSIPVTLDNYVQAETRIGTLEFENGYPSQESVQKLYDEIDFQRACQAYIWGLPMLATEAFVESFKDDLGGQWGDLIEVQSFRDRSYGITANATTDYMFTWVNLEETGPVVIDMPAGLMAGFISDVWQRAPADLGVPGDFGGKGAKHILLGPGQELPTEANGYNIVRSETNHNLILIRIIDPDKETAAKLRVAFQLYPYSDRADPKPTKIIPVGGRVWKTTQPQGFKYWESMAAIIDKEPPNERDRLILATLKPLGIEKGKPFEPTPRQRKILEEALVVGEAMARANGFDTRHPDAEYVEGSQWDFPLVVNPTQRREGYDDLDGRAAWVYEALGISRGMTTTEVGVGSIYLGEYQSGDGEWLDGSRNYKLHVPPNPPAKNFWSVTVYHNVTRYLIQSGTEVADKSSRGDIVMNDDGSVNLYFGPEAPEGMEKNWIKTVPGEGWFAYFRLYGPLEPFFDRSWVLPDIETTN
jgi:hypothetical protein